MGYIYIVPLGEIEQSILEEISAGVNLAFGLPTEIMPITANPNYAFQATRKQYYSTKILENLSSRIMPDASREMRQTDKIIGIVNVDLATPILTFVFGEAQLNGCAAVISINRLKQEFYQLMPNQKILIDRVVKESIHELGHTFGLLHCDNDECVMRFSSNITGIDRKSINFCAQCLTILQKK